MSLSIQDQLDKYLHQLQRHRANSTHQRLSWTLKMILKELNGMMEYEDLLNWAQKKKPTLTPRTWNHYVSELAAFLKWRVRENYLLVNPLPPEWLSTQSYPKVRSIPSQREVQEILQKYTDEVLRTNNFIYNDPEKPAAKTASI